jgi:hypothetical protein
MNAVAEPPQPFPITEGIGIFIGIVAWDVLSIGEVPLLKASIIACIGALIWYGARCWRATHRKRNRTP